MQSFRSEALVAAVLAILSAAVAAQTIPAPEKYREIQALIERGIAEGLAPSLAVAVVEDDRLVWAEGFGLADVAQRRGATADTPYSLASISKPLTATGIMRLVEAGKLELDAPANRYLSGAKLRAFAGNAEEITIRRLANHTAGLATHWSFFYDGVPPPPMDETIRRYGFAAVAPGTEWTYSNLGFGVLSHMLEVVSGLEWDAFLEREVFRPLGMSHTFAVRPGEFIRRRIVVRTQRDADERVHEAIVTEAQPGRVDLLAAAATRYDVDVDGRFVPIADYAFDHPGASALWSSARDLARFLRMHANDGTLDGVRVLSARSTREMRVPTSARVGGEDNGVAFFVGEAFGRARIQHSGGMPGVATRAAAYPEDRHAIVVLTNTGRRGLSNEVAQAIERILFADAVTRPQSTEAESEPAEPSLQHDAFHGRWTGRLHHFAGPIPLEIVISDAPERAMLVRLGAGPERRARGVTWSERGPSGTITAGVETQAGYHGTPELRFSLRLAGERLVGVAAAQASGYFNLPHMVELDRAGPGVAAEAAADARSQPMVAPKRSRFEGDGAPPVDFVLPATWETRPSTSRFRLAEYRIATEPELDCIVYFFGAGDGGGVEANFARWRGQIVGDDPGRSEVLDSPAGRIHTLDVSGTYSAAVRPGSAERIVEPGWSLLGLVLEVSGGPLFVKVVGPTSAVGAARAAVLSWAQSFRTVE